MQTKWIYLYAKQEKLKDKEGETIYIRGSWFNKSLNEADHLDEVAEIVTNQGN